MNRSNSRSRFRDLFTDKKIDLLTKSDLTEDLFLKLVYEFSFDYTLTLHKCIVQHPLFERAMSRISKYLETEILGDKYTVFYSIGRVHLAKKDAEAIYKEDLSEYALEVIIRNIAQFSILTIDLDVQKVFLLVARIAEAFGKDRSFDIILDENLEVLYFHHDDKIVLDRIVGIPKYKDYPLEIKFVPDVDWMTPTERRWIYVESKNSRLFKKTVKKLSSDSVRDIILQIALS